MPTGRALTDCCLVTIPPTYVNLKISQRTKILHVDNVTLIKVISALLYPMGLLLVFVLSRLVFKAFGWRTLSRLCATSFFMVLIFASNPKFARWLASNLEHQYPQRAIQNISKHDAIIVLGGGLRIPTAPALHAQLGHGADRYWYATRLYRSGRASKIVIAGGNVYTQPGLESEAAYASRLLQEWGVPRAAISVETTSRTTQQNLENVVALLEAEKIESALLVTSALHMPRAFALFNRLPIPVTPASADVLVREDYRPSVLDWLPSSSAMQLTTLALHEYYGHWFNRVRGLHSPWLATR